MDTTQLVRQHAPIEYTPLSRGYISQVVELVAGKPKQKAAVTAFTDLLMVVLPSGSSEHLYGPCRWGAIHGSRFPAVGSACVVGVDETNHAVVLWWEGEEKNTAEPTGAAGGALAGEYPNPTLAAPEAWKKLSTLTYKNAWKDLAGQPGEYRKNPFGTVELRGVIESGTSATEAFTLPAGYRPKQKTEAVVLAGTRLFAELEITTAGVVTPFNAGGVDDKSEVKTYVALNCSFSVE